MSNSAFLPQAIINGIDDVVANIIRIDTKAAARVMNAGLRGAMRPIAKAMKADLSPKVKIARKWVGMKRKRNKAGEITAKVGFGVGRTKADRNRIVPKNRPKDRPGVGISAFNVHWWITGTNDRKRKSIAGNPPTGSMPAKQPGLAENAAARVRDQSAHEAQVAARKQLMKEIKRLAKGRR